MAMTFRMPWGKEREMARFAASYDFSGANVLVTGGGSGIGAACSEAFSAAGAHVHLADINEQSAAAMAASLGATGGKATSYAVDVSDHIQVAELVSAIASTSGSLDIAVNNAGIEGDNVPVAEWPLENWRRLMSVNLDGVFHCVRSEVQQMLRQGKGSIVNMASLSGLIGGYNLSAYTAAKHGVVGLTRAVATECATKGIRVNAVCPGLVDTSFVAHLPQSFRDRLNLATPMNRPARPAEIAEVVIWLASDASSYLTGQAIAVDGGTSLAATGTKFDDLIP